MKLRHAVILKLAVLVGLGCVWAIKSYGDQGRGITLNAVMAPAVGTSANIASAANSLPNYWLQPQYDASGVSRVEAQSYALTRQNLDDILIALDFAATWANVPDEQEFSHRVVALRALLSQLSTPVILNHKE